MSGYMWIFAFDGVEQLLTFRIHQYLGHVLSQVWGVKNIPNNGSAKNSTTLQDKIRTNASDAKKTNLKQLWSRISKEKKLMEFKRMT